MYRNGQSCHYEHIYLRTSKRDLQTIKIESNMEKQLNNYETPLIEVINVKLNEGLCQSGPVTECTGTFSYSEGGIDDDEPDV